MGLLSSRNLSADFLSRAARNIWVKILHAGWAVFGRKALIAGDLKDRWRNVTNIDSRQRIVRHHSRPLGPEILATRAFNDYAGDKRRRDDTGTTMLVPSLGEALGDAVRGLTSQPRRAPSVCGSGVSSTGSTEDGIEDSLWV